MSSASSAPVEALAPDHALAARTRALVGLYVVGDTDGVLSMCADGVTFTIPGDPRALPWAGRYEGAGFARFHGAIKDNVDVVDYVAPWLEVWDDRCLLLMRERARVRGTGQSFEHHLLGVFRYQGLGLVAYEEDGDTWAMGRAVAGAPAPAPLTDVPPWVAEAGGWGGSLTRDRACARADGEGEATASLLRAVARAEVEGDRAALRAAAHLGLAVWVGGSDPRLPWAGTATGPTALASAAGERGAVWRRELVDLQVEAFGGSALLRLRERLRLAAGGPTVEVQRSVVAGARGGQLTRWWEWSDTAALGQAYGDPPTR